MILETSGHIVRHLFGGCYFDQSLGIIGNPCEWNISRVGNQSPDFWGTLDHGTDGFQGDGLWWISQIYRSFLVIPFSYTYFEIYKTYKTPQKPWLGRGCTRTWD